MERQFRISSRKLFLTYPQCPVEWSIQSVRTDLFGIVQNIEYWVICAEAHADGTPHFHCALSLSRKLETRNPNYFDIRGKHGNYQGAKNWGDVVRYVCKDGVYESNIPQEEIDQLINGLTDKQIKNKRLLKKALEDGPEKLLEDGDYAIHQFEFVIRGLNAYKKLKVRDEREDLPERLDNDWNLNLKVDTDLKRCHFWIWSHAPNRGKTTFLLSIARRYRAEFWNYGEVFQDRVTKRTECILFDELRGSRLKVTTLNQICDGTFGYPQKGASCISLETGKPLVVVCSNVSIREAYKEEFWDILEARFQDFNLD